MLRSLAAKAPWRFPFTGPTAWSSQPRVIAGFAALAVLMETAGCRSSPRSDGRGPRPASGPTIGHDFRGWPAGTTIPATGLGVDLVDSKALGPGRGQAPIAVPPTVDIETRPARSGAIASDPSPPEMHPSD